MNFNRADLRTIYAHLASLLPPGPRPLNAEQVAAIGGLLDKTKTLIDTFKAAPERGALVLRWRIARELAPTMNEYAFMKTWQRARIRKELDKLLYELTEATPTATKCGSAVRRWVQVTRFTTQPKKVDDAAVDAIGGKMPIDALVRVGLLAGDSPSHCVRHADVQATERGNTHVLVELFETAVEEVDATEPVKGKAPAGVARPLSLFTKSVLEQGESPK